MDLAESDLQRAFIGRIGLFALNDSEAIYFIANEDDDGQPLRSTDQYIIEGVLMMQTTGVWHFMGKIIFSFKTVISAMLTIKHLLSMRIHCICFIPFS